MLPHIATELCYHTHGLPHILTQITSVCLVAGNLTGITGHNGYTIIPLHILISILSSTIAGTVVIIIIIINYNCRTSLECESSTMCNYKLAN